MARLPAGGPGNANASAATSRGGGLRRPGLGVIVITLLVVANIAVRFDTAALTAVAPVPAASTVAAESPDTPVVAEAAGFDDAGAAVAAEAAAAAAAAGSAGEGGDGQVPRAAPGNRTRAMKGAGAVPPAVVAAGAALPGLLATSKAARALYDTTRDIDVHERDYIPKAKGCSVQWCKGVDRRRLASVIYDGKRDTGDTEPRVTRKELEKVHSGVKVKIDGYKWGSSELEYVNDSITELKPTPTEYVRCVKKNVAVGYAINLLPPFLQTFISSFERYHGPCDEAILFVDDMRLAVQLDRTKGNVKFLDRKKWATKIKGAHRLNTGTQRVPVLEAWLKERWHRYHYVVHVDTRDLVFYGNMFTPLYRNNVTGLFSAGEALPFYTSTMNRNWVNKYSGIRVMSDYISTLHLHGRNLPVICSGLYGGTALALYDYFGGFAAAVAAANRAAKETLGIDQGIHVYMQLFGLPLADYPHPIYLLDEGTGPMRHWYTRESTMLRDALGRHVNCEMNAYAVVHQLDRYQWAWEDAFSDYKLGKDNTLLTDCTGAVNETDTFAPFVPADANVGSGNWLAPTPAFVTATMKNLALHPVKGIAGPGSADAEFVPKSKKEGAAPAMAGVGRFEDVSGASKGGGRVAAAERVWEPQQDDGKDASTTRLTSQLHTTVCASHNAVLLFAHIWDPEVLQPLIAAIQRYHTTCDTVVVFVPRQAGYEAIAHGDGTAVIFEAYNSPQDPSGDADDAAAEGDSDGASHEPDASVTVAPTTLVPLPYIGQKGAQVVTERPLTAEEKRIKARRRRATSPLLHRQGRRVALGVVLRWLLRHGAPFRFVTVLEDAARMRIGVFDNLFTPLYRHDMRGVWMLPYAASGRTASPEERVAKAAAVSSDFAESTLARKCLAGPGSKVPEPEVVAQLMGAGALNVSALSSVYGGGTQAVADMLQATAFAMEAMDKAAGTPACSADPFVLEALRSHVLPPHFMRPDSGFPHDVVLLDDLQGPHRHVLGEAQAIPETADRFGRLARCDARRTPYALIVGYARGGTGRNMYWRFREQYRRRGDPIRATGFEAYFETHASGKLCHERVG